MMTAKWFYRLVFAALAGLAVSASSPSLAADIPQLEAQIKTIEGNLTAIKGYSKHCMMPDLIKPRLDEALTDLIGLKSLLACKARGGACPTEPVTYFTNKAIAIGNSFGGAKDRLAAGWLTQDKTVNPNCDKNAIVQYNSAKTLFKNNFLPHFLDFAANAPSKNTSIATNPAPTPAIGAR